MRPTLAHCGKCNAQVSILSKERAPTTCPLCKQSLRFETFDVCASCQCKVGKGVIKCEACKLTTDPSYAGKPPR